MNNYKSKITDHRLGIRMNMVSCMVWHYFQVHILLSVCKACTKMWLIYQIIHS